MFFPRGAPLQEGAPCFFRAGRLFTRKPGNPMFFPSGAPLHEGAPCFSGAGRLFTREPHVFPVSALCPQRALFIRRLGAFQRKRMRSTAAKCVYSMKRACGTARTLKHSTRRIRGAAGKWAHSTRRMRGTAGTKTTFYTTDARHRGENRQIS